MSTEEMVGSLLVLGFFFLLCYLKFYDRPSSRQEAFKLDGHCIADMEAAIAVGTAVLAGWQRKGEFQGYTLKSCDHHEDPSYWILRFVQPDSRSDREVRMNVRQSTGEVEIWVVE